MVDRIEFGVLNNIFRNANFVLKNSESFAGGKSEFEMPKKNRCFLGMWRKLPLVARVQIERMLTGAKTRFMPKVEQFDLRELRRTYPCEKISL